MNSQLIHQLTNTNVTDSNLNFFTHVTLSGSERVEAETTVTSLFYLAHCKFLDYLYSKKKPTVYCAENNSKNIYNNSQLSVV